MATKVHMEALSPTMEEGQIVRWLKAEGAAVTNGEVIAEVETDKATMELVARADGKLRKIFISEGGVAPVGSVIAVIGAEGEDISAFVPEGGAAQAGAASVAAQPAAAAEAAAPAAHAGTSVAAPPKAQAPAAVAEPPVVVEGPRADGARVKASPLARRLAADGGISLASVRGSGPGGRIVKRDVEMAAKEPAAVARPALPPPSTADYADVPLTQMRKTIARRLVESIGPVPHFFLTIDVDMTRVVDARKRVNALLDSRGIKVSFNDIVLKATAVALRQHPNCNSHWGGDHIRQFNRVHLGVAVAVEDGLITPIVRDAHVKGIAQIAEEVREMAGRAREKKLKPEEYTGATFSVSNLGMFGIEAFTGVINPPEAGILAVGALEERAVVEAGQVVVRPRMRITMSCDHRVIDGAQAARFLETLRAILEEPLAALV
jgi:pyruvate dehydrogenase E2 component (dihydrolipoamide acetyltransferase)